MRKVITYVNNSDFPVISLVFTVSASIFILALCSFMQILDFIPIHHYPMLVTISALSVFMIEFFLPDFLKKYNSAYNVLFISLISSVVISVTTFHPAFNKFNYTPHGIYFSDLLFVLSISLIDLLKNSLKVIVFHTTSKLKNPKLDNDIMWAKNSGTLFSAVYLLLFASSQNFWLPLTCSVIPSLSSLIMLYYVQQVRNNVEESFENVAKIEDQLERTTEFSKNNFPFLYLVFSLVFVSYFVIEVQNFVTLLALYEYKNKYQVSTIVFYSSLAVIQTFLGIGLSLGYNALFKREHRWSLQFKSQFGYSCLSFMVLFFKTNPLTLLVSGSFSKLIHEAFAEHKEHLFYMNIPKYIRQRVEAINKTYVFLSASFFASIIIFFSIKSIIPMNALWFIGVVASAFGIFLRFELQKVFSDYHVGQIVRSDIYEAVEYCKHLANVDSKNRYSAITSILNQEPRPFLAKALLNILGKIETPEVVPELIQLYHNSKRDDVKLAVLNALANYESHHIDLFLLECLEEIVTQDKFNSELKKELFNTITDKLEDIAIPMVLKILKHNATEFRIIANAILVLGEIAIKTNDDSLFELISKYTKPIFSRRIRCNASLYLYKKRKYREIANACMSSLLTSNNEYDRNAVAFMAGELKVYTMTPFILEISERVEHKNTTLLISLLKLDYPQATDMICELMQSADLKAVQGILSQINMIKDINYRYKIYYRYLEMFSDKIDHLLEQMSLSEKNFDADRMTIRNEALKLGCYVNHDTKLFLKDGHLYKVA